jgi:Trk K+ transport system NAD-binding subunit
MSVAREAKSVVIVGAGRVAYSIANILRRQGTNVLGFTDIVTPSEHVSGLHRLLPSTIKPTLLREHEARSLNRSSSRSLFD